MFGIIFRFAAINTWNWQLYSRKSTNSFTFQSWFTKFKSNEIHFTIYYEYGRVN